MNGRGRKSVAALGIVTNDGKIVDASQKIGSYPIAPPDLDEKEAVLWDQIVRTKPGEWFTSDTLPLLHAYIKSITASRRIESQISALTDSQLKRAKGMARYNLLRAICTREGNLQATLATKMRLTQQSRYTPKAAGTAANKVTDGRKPWEK